MLSYLFQFLKQRLTGKVYKCFLTIKITLNSVNWSFSCTDFTGTAVINGSFIDLKLSDFQGKYVVFFFYPLDFTFVCKNWWIKLRTLHIIEAASTLLISIILLQVQLRSWLLMVFVINNNTQSCLLIVFFTCM